MASFCILYDAIQTLAAISRRSQGAYIFYKGQRWIASTPTTPTIALEHIPPNDDVAENKKSDENPAKGIARGRFGAFSLANPHRKKSDFIKRRQGQRTS